MHARVVQHTIQYVCTWRLDGIKFSHMFVGKLSLLHPQNGNGFCSYNWKTSQLLSSTCLINTREAATCKLSDEIWRKSSIMQSKIKSWNFSLVGKINYLVIDSFFCRRVANSTRTLSLRKTSLLFINAFVNFFVILIDLSSLRYQVEVKCQKHKFPNKKRNNVCKSEGGEQKSCSLMIKRQIRAQREKHRHYLLSSVFELLSLPLYLVCLSNNGSIKWQFQLAQFFNQFSLNINGWRPELFPLYPLLFCFCINILEAINLNMEENKMRRLEICEPHNFHSRYTLYISFRREKKD